MLNNIIKFFLENRLVTIILLSVFIAWGVISSPFGWDTGFLPKDAVPVDAIPDIGENQQIVYTQWAGQSPQDIEDQVSYPLTTALLGIPGVKTIRSNSIFGVSSIYIIFDEGIEFYWSRSRILEKLNSLPEGTLPNGVSPSLGPDATALGQVLWYTLEGRDKEGKPSGSWDPQELRSIQDFYVKYALTSVKGVSEVASIGGYVKEYQIDIDPNAMKAHAVGIGQIIKAVKESNLDVGARTIEFNRVEYLIRALGYVKSLEDLEKSVVTVRNNIPIRIKDVAKVSFGPATRRGGLDKGGADAVGGVVVARYGANPLEVINHVKEKIEEIAQGLPSKTLKDGSVSKVTIIPFYDRSGLIYETLGTLEEALSLEILISIIVVLILVFNLRASFLISSLLPIGVLITFVVMHKFGVDANIVALSGIAIAIGVMVDVGVVFTENIIRHISLPENKGATGKALKKIIYTATTEVAPAVLTAIATTVISFMPVFAMEAAEGKLFRPLAFTKTFVMLAALVVGLVIIPTLAHIIFSIKFDGKKIRRYSNIILALAGIALLFFGNYFIGVAVIAYALNNFFAYLWNKKKEKYINYINIAIVLLVVVRFLSEQWMPLGAQYSEFLNLLFVAAMISAVLVLLSSIIYFYPRILSWALANKWTFLSLPIFVIIFGFTAWQGFDKVFGFSPQIITQTDSYQSLKKIFPGIGKEFMPSLDEGSFLLMPTTMPHSGVEENIEVIRLLDKKVNAIPEVANVVGKWGRVNSALDPAPISMYENVINYKSEYILNKAGHRERFKMDGDAFVLKDGTTYNPANGFRVIAPEKLIPDADGEYFRQWRENIQSSSDIWDEIIANSNIPGLTSAPKLQPIQTRLVMLQTGMRAPMGIKVFGPDLESIEKLGLQIETLLKQVEGVSKMSVFADRVVGKPYIEIHINREAIARYGMSIKNFQTFISSAVGGMPLSSTVEGRERYPIRVRYAREFRDNPEDLKKLLISTPMGTQIPLGELATIEYTRGAQLIKSENTFLVGYVIFDKMAGFAEVDVVENAQKYLNKKVKDGTLVIPAGVNYTFTGNYENQIRATKRLMLVIPIALLVIFLILYFQFRSVIGASLIFSGILVAFSGGFIMLWLYGQPWFMNFSIGNIHMQNLFQIDTINLSVAVWVGFIALFGIATDDGVLISTYIKQIFDKNAPESREEVREKILEAGKKRVRPAIMTTATTLIALLPVLTSRGKGSDIMVPMAIPIFGGMVIALLTIFVVPVLYSMWQESLIKKIGKKELKENKSHGKPQAAQLKKALFIILLLSSSSLLTAQDILNGYLLTAAENNPTLKAKFSEYHASLEKIPQVGTLPDPSFTFGYFILPVETKNGPQQAKFSFSQMFPWFGTLNSKEEVFVNAAKAKYEAFEEAKSKLFFEVKANYFDLYFIHQSIEITLENIRILETFKRLALIKIEAGSASGVDALRVEMSLADLENNLALLRDKWNVNVIRFNNLLNTSTDNDIKLPIILWTHDLVYTKQAVMDSLHANNHQLKTIDYLKQSFESSELMAKKLGSPNIVLGADYTTIGHVDATPNAGKDALMIKIGISLPIYRKKYSAMVNEAIFQQEAMEHKKEAKMNVLETLFEKTYSQYSDAKRRMILFEKQSTLGRRAIKLLESEYASEGRNFEEILRMERSVLKYSLELEKARADKQASIGFITYLMGI